MSSYDRLILFSLLFLVGFTSGTSAQTELSGQLTNGSYYAIVVPDGWNPATGW